MSGRKMDEAMLLELGLLAGAVAIAGAAVVFGGGRLVEEFARGRRHRAAPPTRGSISGERHRHVTSVAAR